MNNKISFLIIGVVVALFAVAIVDASRGTQYKVEVESLLYGVETVTTDFAPAVGQVVRVYDGEAMVYEPGAVIQHVGHVARVKEVN